MKALNQMRRPWNLGRESPFKGKSHSPEVRQQISDSRTGQVTSRVYTPLSDESKMKISKANKGKVSPPQSAEARCRALARLKNGAMSEIIKGSIWINNGTDNKRIKPEQLESYPGFVKGRLVPVRNHSGLS